MTSAENLSFKPPTIDVSFPKSVKMHVIYDSELSMLAKAGKDASLEWALAAGGAALGFVQNLIRAASAVWDGNAPDFLDFVLALLCVVLVATAVVCYRQSGGVRSAIDDLVEEIRKRSG